MQCGLDASYEQAPGIQVDRCDAELLFHAHEYGAMPMRHLRLHEEFQNHANCLVRWRTNENAFLFAH
jgi:hypothetical protein